MKKFTLKLSALVLALLVSQGIMAQENEKVLYQEPFDFGMGEFTIEGFNGDAESIWQWFFYMKGIYCDASGKITEPLENRLVSPEIKLEKNNRLSFMSTTEKFTDVAEEIAVSVRLKGGEWKDYPIPTADNSGSAVEQLFTIPSEYNDNTVQIGLKYTAKSGDDCGTWLVQNFIVKGNAGGGSAEKQDPGISFDITVFEYNMGEEYISPVLNNPNNLTVTYSSSNKDVVTVDAFGALTFYGGGEATIKAVSAETDKFMAGEASYLVKVSDGTGGGGAPEEVAVIFEELFTFGMGDFVVEGDNGADDNIWSWREGAQDMSADSYSKISGPVENRLVSPKLMAMTDNVVSFLSTASIFSGNNDDVSFSVREVGGEWEDMPLPIPDGMGSTLEQKIKLPAKYDNKTIQFAFKYRASSAYTGPMWYIDDVSMMGKEGSSVPQKTDPEIAFEKDAVEFTYVEGSDKMFESPALINPYGVPVKYTSNNASVAAVDELTGKVTIMGEGSAKITATSEETDEYRSAAASYTVTFIIIPAGIEGVDADVPSNAVIYDLQGRRVYAPSKGIFIVNGRKVVIK